MEDHAGYRRLAAPSGDQPLPYSEHIYTLGLTCEVPSTEDAVSYHVASGVQRAGQVWLALAALGLDWSSIPVRFPQGLAVHLS